MATDESRNVERLSHFDRCGDAMTDRPTDRPPVSWERFTVAIRTLRKDGRGLDALDLLSRIGLAADALASGEHAVVSPKLPGPQAAELVVGDPELIGGIRHAAAETVRP
jgi:hypothetical protein